MEWQMAELRSAFFGVIQEPDFLIRKQQDPAKAIISPEAKAFLVEYESLFYKPNEDSIALKDIHIFYFNSIGTENVLTVSHSTSALKLSALYMECINHLRTQNTRALNWHILFFSRMLFLALYSFDYAYFRQFNKHSGITATVKAALLCITTNMKETPVLKHLETKVLTVYSSIHQETNNRNKTRS